MTLESSEWGLGILYHCVTSLPPQSVNCQGWDQQLLRGGSWWSLGLDLAPPPAQLSPAAARRWAVSCETDCETAGGTTCEDGKVWQLSWRARMTQILSLQYCALSPLTDWQLFLLISHSNLSHYPSQHAILWILFFPVTKTVRSTRQDNQN